MPGISALRKITAKDVMKGKIEKETAEVVVTNEDGSPLLNDKGEKVLRQVSRVKALDVFMLYGTAHNFEVGNTQYGDYTVFIGSFEAQRLNDGERFQSTKCIFPPIADDIALQSYMAAKKGDDLADVDFAFIIGIEHDDRGATGYKFTCKPVNAGEERNDPLARLRSSLGAKFAAALGTDVSERLGLADASQTALKVEGEAKVLEAPTGKGKAKADA